MKVQAGVREVDRVLTQRAGSRVPPDVGRVLSAVEEAAEGSKLWCGTAAALAAFGGWRGRRAAAAGLAALAVAQLLGNGLCKQLARRPRPPKEWVPHDEVEDRPDSPSFPSGHTAAAVAFTAAVAPVWPAVGAVCAVPAAMVAVERVQSGAHYPSDVAGGAVVGLAGAWLARRLPRLVLRRRLKPGP
ncbi:phosphatase PAP2 family protein [Streptomyces echinoruber]|uniref:phosphatase PAP2 family protein n=1 Tax=Streptomyces echinoruber TaxID=68898 RepID=UPI00167CB7B2|nr:phosphatase PAP2 family protein [Streptomyces echinoruber]